MPALARSLPIISLLLGATTASTDPSLLLLRRQTEADLCQPPVDSSSGLIPPCTSIETIETLCLPNGTTPLHLSAHAQCMCGGSFFADWVGCRSCLVSHGFLSESDSNRFVSALSVVSTAMCAASATPTAEFNVLFESAAAAQQGEEDDDGSTETGVDRLGGSTDVSLYYTYTDNGGSQGPGEITGGAAGATATEGTADTTESASRTTITGTNTPSTTATDGAGATAGSGDDKSKGGRFGVPALMACGVAAVIAGL